jgi:hypothetical protein
MKIIKLESAEIRTTSVKELFCTTTKKQVEPLILPLANNTIYPPINPDCFQGELASGNHHTTYLFIIPNSPNEEDSWVKPTTLNLLFRGKEKQKIDPKTNPEKIKTFEKELIAILHKERPGELSLLNPKGHITQQKDGTPLFKLNPNCPYSRQVEDYLNKRIQNRNLEFPRIVIDYQTIAGSTKINTEKIKDILCYLAPGIGGDNGITIPVPTEIKILLRDYLMPYAPSPTYNIPIKAWEELKPKINLRRILAILSYTPSNGSRILHLNPETDHLSDGYQNIADNFLVFEKTEDPFLQQKIYHTFGGVSSALKDEKFGPNNEEGNMQYRTYFENFLKENNLNPPNKTDHTSILKG